MDAEPVIPEPSRATEIARLELAKLDAEMPLEEVFGRACELAADVLGVERVGVWLFVDHRAVLRCVNLYERSKGEHSSGAVLRVEDSPKYFGSLTLRKAVPAELAATDAWTAELAEQYLTPLGISSVLDAGIFVNNDLVGVVCHEHVGPPIEWTTEARDFAASVADLLALRIQSAEARDLQAAFLTEQDQLIAREKILALEHFAAGAAHGLRNLLTVFLSHGELLCDRTDLPPEAQALAADIVVYAKRGAAISQELIDFARPPSGPLAVLDIAAATAGLLPQLRAGLGDKYQLNFRCLGRVGQALVNRAQFARMVNNMILHARDAMPRGGAIELTLSSVALSIERCGTNRYVQIDVADHGEGVDEATLSRFFEPYVAVKSPGNGLVLAIVRQLAERAGGFVRVASQVGKGTTIRLFLPRIGAGLEGTVEPEPASTSS